MPPFDNAHKCKPTRVHAHASAVRGTKENLAMAINLYSKPAASPSTTAIQRLISHYQQGSLSEARREAEALTSKFPSHPVAWTILGAVHRTVSDNEAALICLKKAAELIPSDANNHFNLANTYRDLGHGTQAIEHYRRALKLKPELPNGFFHLGNLQHDAGLLQAAEKSFRHALKLNPGHLETLSNLAHLLQDMGQMQDALALYDEALRQHPKQGLLHYNRSDTLQELGRFSEAAQAARTAIQLEPHMAEAHARLAEALLELGELDHAVAAYEAALALAPNNLTIHSSLLFTLNYTPSPDRHRSLELARSYGQKTKVGARDLVVHPWNGNISPKRLRVALVSADFRIHPVGHFLEGILQNIDPQKIELIAINTQTFEDSLTQRIRPHFHEWHSIAGLPDGDAAVFLRGLGTHALLDLSGHTAGNRLPLFAHRLAPVQATWLGYFATTGVDEMDFLIADPITLPESLECDFLESIWRLPDTRLCFTAPNEAIQVNALPALSNAGITFGSFNNLVKLNDKVIQLWSGILHSLPTSRLLLMAKQLHSPEVRSNVLMRFAKHGISKNQLILEEPAPRKKYLETYHRVDVCLDPFPFPGGTTTAEALWMGVPVVTLRGERFVERQGAGLLHNAGLDAFIASDTEDYRARAIRLADNLAALAQLRMDLRERVLASPVFNSAKFAANLTAALWSMWEQRKPR